MEEPLTYIYGRNSIMKRVFWCLLFLALAISCLEGPDCYQKINNYVGISFRKVSNGHLDTVKIISIHASGTSHRYDSLASVTSVTLPINYLIDSTAFLIKTIDRTYLLNLGYHSQPQFLKVDCKEHFVLSGLVVKHKVGIDSVQMISNVLSNPAHLNLTIYRCPRPTLMKLSFRQYNMDTVSHGVLDTRAITSITSDFSGTLYQNTSSNLVTLPVNTNSDRATYTFKFADGTTNTLSLSHTISLQTRWSGCGLQKFPDLLNPLQQNFEVLHIKNDSIYDPPLTNIETFRCPTTHQVKAIFKDAVGTAIVATVKSITADFLSAPLYTNVVGSEVILPLNPAFTNATYYFEFTNSTGVLKLGYNVADQTFHKDCGVQKVFTLLTVSSSSGFSKAPTVTDTSAKFPVGNNLEIFP